MTTEALFPQPVYAGMCSNQPCRPEGRRYKSASRMSSHAYTENQGYLSSLVRTRRGDCSERASVNRCGLCVAGVKSRPKFS